MRSLKFSVVLRTTTDAVSPQLICRNGQLQGALVRNILRGIFGKARGRTTAHVFNKIFLQRWQWHLFYCWNPSFRPIRSTLSPLQFCHLLKKVLRLIMYTSSQTLNTWGFPCCWLVGCIYMKENSDYRSPRLGLGTSERDPIHNLHLIDSYLFSRNPGCKK